MKRCVMILSLLVMSLACPATGFAQGPGGAGPTGAQTAVEKWLSLMDQGKISETYTTAAGMFRNAVTAAAWDTAAKGVRTPLGSLQSRTLKSTTAATTLPGAPDGEYVVFQFNTTFAQKAAAVETVTAVREPDGSWHVGGYFIR